MKFKVISILNMKNNKNYIKNVDTKLTLCYTNEEIKYAHCRIYKDGALKGNFISMKAVEVKT